ncbi:MAG: polyisoprenoid-binding protein [Paucibacter sp.]|nr:polyisoprenoid-binding protein [Roseateles sp.]
MKKTLFALALAAAGLAHAETATYAIDPTHTYVTYEIQHFGTSTNRGRFDKKEGTVQLDKAAKTGRVEVTFDPASINTGYVAMDTHVKSAEILDVEQFPKVTFVGDKFTFDGDKVASVSGQLTMKGKTGPVTLKATHFNCYTNPMLKREVCGGDFETVIDRPYYGVDYGVAYGFSKTLKLVIQVEAIKQ